MEWILTCWDGTELPLPEPVEWELEYTAGSPCDSFSVICPWEPGGLEGAQRASGFRLAREGETLFRGVVDEVEHRADGSGGALEVSGRGMAALLLDNEAMPADYETATAEDILRDHVEPYGIQVGELGDLPAVSGFSVQSGESEWQVLYQFARYHGGVSPRFDRWGRLVLSQWQDGQERVVDDSSPVTALARRDRRYGVLSQVLVRDRWSGQVQSVSNRDFLERGGQARRVVTMPSRSNYKTMRYNGKFQLDKSAAELQRLEVTVAQPFCAWPGELVRIQRSGWDWNGRYRAAQVTVGMDQTGYWSRLELARPDVIG